MGKGFRTLSQLRNTVWTNEVDALRDLKASGLKPVGSDYALGEHKPGSWMLLDRTDDDASQETTIPAKTAPAPRKMAAPAKKAAAFGDKIKGGNANPKTRAEAKAEAKAAKKAAAPAKADETPPATDGAPGEMDFKQPLPHAGKPYKLVLEEGVGFPAHAANTTARELARVMRSIVRVYDKDDTLIGWIDGTKLTGGAAKKAARPSGGATRARSAEPSDMQAKLIKLATRKEGVTRVQIAKDISDRKLAWTTMIKECERFGYTYSTTEAKEGSGARTVYHLTKV